MKSRDQEHRIRIPGSKSILQRLLIILCINRQNCTIKNWNRCQDVQELSKALHGIGMKVSVDADNNAEISFTQHHENNIQCEIAESATALRFLLAFLAAMPGLSSKINISEGLAKRPHEPLVRALCSMGADIEYQGLSFNIIGKKLKSEMLALTDSISSQFFSALALIVPLLQQDLHLRLSESMVSQSYFSLTIDLLSKFGINSNSDAGVLTIFGNGKYDLPKVIEVEADWSSLAWFAGWAALSEKGIILEVDYANSMQPDRRIVDILRDLGAEIKTNAKEVFIRKGKLKGAQINCLNNPDLVPLLSILALFTEDGISLSGIEHLQYKESNRIEGITNALKAIGADYSFDGTELWIGSYNLSPPTMVLDTQADHRLLMAFSLLRIFHPQLVLSETESVNKSFPEFMELSHQLC